MKRISLSYWAYTILSIVFLITAGIGVVVATTGDKPYDERNYLLILSGILLLLVSHFRNWAKEEKTKLEEIGKK